MSLDLYVGHRFKLIERGADEVGTEKRRLGDDRSVPLWLVCALIVAVLPHQSMMVSGADDAYRPSSVAMEYALARRADRAGPASMAAGAGDGARLPRQVSPFESARHSRASSEVATRQNPLLMLFGTS